MVRKAPLRSVAPDEKAPARRAPAKRVPRTVKTAAKTGSRRELLVAMRDRIAEAVTDPKCPPRDLASLTKRLDDVVEKIESFDAREREESEAIQAREAIVDDGGDTFDAEAL